MDCWSELHISKYTKLELPSINVLVSTDNIIRYQSLAVGSESESETRLQITLRVREENRTCDIGLQTIPKVTAENRTCDIGLQITLKVTAENRTCDTGLQTIPELQRNIGASVAQW